MTLYQIQIEHYDNLFGNLEINWVEAKSLKEAKKKIKQLLKLEKWSTIDRYFMKKESKIKKITVIGELG